MKSTNVSYDSLERIDLSADNSRGLVDSSSYLDSSEFNREKIAIDRGLFPKPPALEKIETPEQKRARELQARSMEIQRRTLLEKTEGRIYVAKQQGNQELVNQLLAEAKQLFY